jgi:hypothetical protein
MQIEPFRPVPRFGRERGEDAMARDHGAGIKDDTLYEQLRKQGDSKEKAARIANASANGSIDHRGDTLEQRTKADLLEEAREIGIDGRSGMDKAELAKAIRGHK